MMSTAYLALGANLGDRLATFRAVRRALAADPASAVLAASSLFETEPVGGPPGQGTYFNAVLRLATTLPPAALLARCMDLEGRFGRVRTERWGARTLDLDLLFYDDLVCDDPQLTLPHPRLHQRRFVLAPLLELDPELRHPRLGRTLRELYEALDDPAAVRRLHLCW